MKRSLFFLGLLLLLAGPAAAHADFVNSEPPPNSRLDEAPERLVIELSEGVEDRYTRIQVLDQDGRDHATDTEVLGNGRSVIATDLEPMADGVYTVTWRALSYDSHTTSGAFLLAINASFGNATLPQNAQVDSTPVRGHDVVARAVAFAGALVAVGLPVFFLFIHRYPALLPVSAAFAALAAFGDVLVLAAVAARIESSLLDAAATDTGRLMALRAGLHVAAGVALLAAWRARMPWGVHISAVLAAAALGAMAFGSHAAAQTEGRLLAITVDGLHLAAAAFWVSGVLAMFLLAKRGAADDLRSAGQRFTPAAIASVIVLVVTGSYGAVLHMNAWKELVTTLYGQALLAKILLLAPLLLLGQQHRLRIRRQDRPNVNRSLLAETLLMAVVLVAAAVLTAASPPQAQDEALPDDPEERQRVLQERGWIHVDHEGSLFVYNKFQPFPPRVGHQNITVLLDEPDGRLPENVRVLLTLKPPSDPHGEGRLVTPERLDESTWAIEGTLFTEAGTWRLETTVQGKDFYLKASLRLDVAPP